jgi:hypothetical protein
MALGLVTSQSVQLHTGCAGKPTNMHSHETCINQIGRKSWVMGGVF